MDKKLASRPFRIWIKITISNDQSMKPTDQGTAHGVVGWNATLPISIRITDVTTFVVRNGPGLHTLISRAVAEFKKDLASRKIGRIRE